MYLPMFPLGSVLFPSQVLPLHIFEERYRALVHDVLDGERQFGVVLIERGHEVGGGDVRRDIGTAAEIVGAQEFPDGRWALATVGTGRIRVIEWLPDDPYPRAVVEELDDVLVDDETADALRPAATRATEVLRRSLALLAELGEQAAPPTVDLAEELTLRAYQIAALAPLTAWDKQQLLELDDPAVRFARATDLIVEQNELLEARRAAGP